MMIIDDPDAIALKMISFQNIFHPHENKTPAFSNSSGLKSVFQKLRLLNGRPNRRNKAAFANLSVLRCVAQSTLHGPDLWER